MMNMQMRNNNDNNVYIFFIVISHVVLGRGFVSLPSGLSKWAKLDA